LSSLCFVRNQKKEAASPKADASASTLEGDTVASTPKGDVAAPTPKGDVAALLQKVMHARNRRSKIP
jgi:hypothetical protein